MAYNPKEAWSNAGRLIAIVAGFGSQKKRRLSINSIKYNEQTNHHEISLKLELRHDPLLLGVNSVMEESIDIESFDLIREINLKLDQ